MLRLGKLVSSKVGGFCAGNAAACTVRNDNMTHANLQADCAQLAWQQPGWHIYLNPPPKNRVRSLVITCPTWMMDVRLIALKQHIYNECMHAQLQCHSH